MELEPLHCLLGHSTNTASSNLRAQKEYFSPVRSQKSPSFPILGLYSQNWFKPPAVLPSFHSLCGSGYLQGFCKDPASYSQGIYLSLITWKFLKYQVILNHTVLPQENCFTYIKYIRLSKRLYFKICLYPNAICCWVDFFMK